MTPELLLSIRNNYLPPTVGSRFVILCAIKDSNGVIVTDADFSYQILKGNATIEQLGNIFTITCSQISDVIIEFSGSNLSINQVNNYYSFRVTLQSYAPQVNDYQLMLNSESPGSFLDPNYLDSPAWAQGAVNWFSCLNSTLNNTYPNLSTNINWLYSLWSTQQPLYFNNPNFKYQDLFVFLRNLRVSCTLNPFDLAWHISYFIYLVSGIKAFVYIDENKNAVPPATADYTIYVLVTPVGQWVLDVSLLGINTVLGGIANLGPLIPTINFFIAKIFRSSRNYNVDYTQTPSGLGLNTILDNVYKGDVNLNRTYCIQYEPSNFTLAQGRVFTTGEEVE